MRFTGVAGALLLATVLLPGAGHAQRPDAVEVRPGAQYGAGPLTRWLLGSGYRHLWTAPLQVPVLDLGRFAGGLEPLERGGGHQTRTLHLQGADGRRYVFRSVDKFVAQVLPEDLQNTLAHRLAQDHMAMLHPTGALALPPLLQAAGVLHVTPQLAIMPDDPRLGEHRAGFAGMLGIIEERADEGADGTPGFAGSTRVVGTDRLIERLQEDPLQRVASEEYLRARLVDFVVGDTDRGSDQWRWVGEDVPGGGVLFRPVPRDRDWAFIRSNGILSGVARFVFPKLAEYDDDYPSLKALTMASIHRDRQFLADLPWSTWAAVTASLQAALTDDVITRAVAALPPEHVELEGARLRAELTGRRDELPRVARRFYHYLAGEVDVLASDEADVATVEVQPDGALDVAVGGAGAEPRFRRRFLPGETREVRIHLGGGDDRAVVRGAAGSPVAVRIVGGAGDDVMADSTAPGTIRVTFHDDEGDNTVHGPPGTGLDRRPFVLPAADDDFLAAKVTKSRYRDWGRGSSLRPTVAYGSGPGLVLGARLTRTQRGFRHVPHAQRTWVEAQYALREGGFGLEAGGHWTRRNSPWSAGVDLLARQFDELRFYGLGNDAPHPEQRGIALVMQDRVELVPTVAWAPDWRRRLAVGLIGQYVDPRPLPGSPLGTSTLPGSAAFGSLGVFAGAELRRTDREEAPRTGWALDAAAALHPVVMDLPGTFGTAEAEARAYVTAGPTLALRAGARRAWGDYPVQEAAAIGGKRSLRGFRRHRFTGDGALYGTAELRLPLGRAPLLLVRGNVGAFAFGDAGRVFVDGSSPGGWHTGYGAGLWFTTLGQTIRLSWASGEQQRLYLEFGAGF